jgi:hypothetical protein
MRLAFVNAVTKVNMHSEVGPGRNIIYDMKTIAPHDSFKANTDGKNFITLYKTSITYIQIKCKT